MRETPKFVLLIFMMVLLLPLASSLSLNCLMTQENLSGSGIVKVCTVTNLVVSYPGEYITSVNVISLNDTSKVNDDQQGNIFPIVENMVVKITGPNVHYLPKGLELFFPKIVGLTVQNGLKSIAKSDLDVFPNLLELKIPNNAIKAIYSDVFQGNKMLRTLSVNDNSQLKYVGSSVFSNLNSLTNVNFGNSGCFKNQRYNYYNNYDVKSSITSACPSPDGLNTIFCQRDIDYSRYQLSKLETQIKNLEVETSRLESESKSLQKMLNDNLDYATKNLFLASKKIESYEAISSRSVKGGEEEEKQQNVDIVIKCSQLGKHCDATRMNVEFDGSSIVDVSYENGENVEKKNVGEFFISRQSTLFLPDNIGEIFPNLLEFGVFQSGLYKIDSKVFRNMNQLILLRIVDNKIIDIPQDAFIGLTQLQGLDMTRNNIEKLNPGVFSSLKNLNKLILKHNKLTAVTFEMFEHLQILQTFDLSENQLKFISPNLLSVSEIIEKVDLTKNDCIDISYPEDTKHAIEASIIDNCVAPVRLNCTVEFLVIENSNESQNITICQAQDLNIEYPKTKISDIFTADNSVLDIEKLRNLTISDQSIKFLPFQLGNLLPSLEILIVDSSQLVALQKGDFAGFSKLKTIKIRFNNLTALGDGVFDDVTLLKHLDLSSNNIRTLPSEFFTKLIHLKTLILSKNQIEKFTASFLPRKNAIEVFKLDENELEIIETKTLRYLRKASVIDLTSNVCIDLKFDKSDVESKKLVELSGEVDLNCSPDD